MNAAVEDTKQNSNTRDRCALFTCFASLSKEDELGIMDGIKRWPVAETAAEEIVASNIYVRREAER